MSLVKYINKWESCGCLCCWSKPLGRPAAEPGRALGKAACFPAPASGSSLAFGISPDTWRAAVAGFHYQTQPTPLEVLKGPRGDNKEVWAGGTWTWELRASQSAKSSLLQNTKLAGKPGKSESKGRLQRGLGAAGRNERAAHSPPASGFPRQFGRVLPLHS